MSEKVVETTKQERNMLLPVWAWIVIIVLLAGCVYFWTQLNNQKTKAPAIATISQNETIADTTNPLINPNTQTNAVTTPPAVAIPSVDPNNYTPIYDDTASHKVLTYTFKFTVDPGRVVIAGGYKVAGYIGALITYGPGNYNFPITDGFISDVPIECARTEWNKRLAQAKLANIQDDTVIKEYEKNHK